MNRKFYFQTLPRINFWSPIIGRRRSYMPHEVMEGILTPSGSYSQIWPFHFFFFPISLNQWLLIYCFFYCCCLVTQSCLTLCDPIDCFMLGSCPWDVPGKNTGIGCQVLFQGIFLTQESNLHLLHWQTHSLPLSHLESPNILLQVHKLNWVLE